MKSTVLITGCSSGIGKATVREFHSKGWEVIATMRNPADGADLADLAGVRVMALDVTSPAQIEAVASSLEKEGVVIDALVNNAGYGLFGPFETATDEVLRNQFETNVFGVFNLTRRFLPSMRAKGSGVIVNVGSIGSIVNFPMNSIYHATKFALHGFSLGLAYELVPFGLRVRLVAPGGVATDFAGRSLKPTFQDNNHPYAAQVKKVQDGFNGRRGTYSTPEEIAKDIYETSIDPGTQVLVVAGEQGRGYVKYAQSMSETEYQAAVRTAFGL